MDLYKQTVERLAVVLDTFLSSNANSIASSSGMFVNTMGWVDGQGYELLLHAIEGECGDDGWTSYDRSVPAERSCLG